MYPVASIESLDTEKTKSFNIFAISPARCWEEVEHFLKEIANTIAVLAGPVSRLRSSLPYRADAKFFGEIRCSESNQSTVAKRKNC